MNTKNIVIGGLAVLALLIGFLTGRGLAQLTGGVNPTGPQHYQMEAFLQGLTGGTRNQLVIDNAGQIFETAFAYFGGTTAATALGETSTVGSCAGTATSTQFAIANPFNATSTVTLGEISGVNTSQATDFVVGTSTLSSVTATSSLNAVGTGYAGMFNIASGASFFTVPGFKTGPALGYQSPAGGTYTTQAEIVVGPSEKLVGYATSTAVTGGFGVTSCTYKFKWQR